MPLPNHALRIEGGCNCLAVRYSVKIPELAKRPIHPLAPTKAPVPLPFLVLDHCNDCRRATGSLLPAWLCAPIDMASVSLVHASSATLARNAIDRKNQAEEQRGAWEPALDVFTSTPSASDHFLKSYESSNERWRWFCSRCGTNIAYTAVMPEGFPNMLDIAMGSVDRCHLETSALIPERHLWWDYGINWVQRLSAEGFGSIPIHPDYRIAELVNPELEKR
ncbi:hypothetical protein K491DRAFT_612767 [Lophiostoma macrostomum CBS 122681]|uniref:CENP-V/GFA domain-containing protein n=1 Tax=Lophiostoma macrostomum CBS 122681 TaxID=1314788 RepID=A0A6A6SN41_9PLEO|nr:hypothetical protein K491DRAFT_612767 [Lophiostoma macrostomum CBS 122681]